MNQEKKMILKILAELEIFRTKVETKVIPEGSSEWAIRNCQDIISNMVMSQYKEIGLKMVDELESYREDIEARVNKGTAEFAIRICQSTIAKGHFETRVQWSDILRRDRTDRMIEIITKQLTNTGTLYTDELYSACEDQLGTEFNHALFTDVINQLMNEGLIVRETYPGGKHLYTLAPSRIFGTEPFIDHDGLEKHRVMEQLLDDNLSTYWVRAKDSAPSYSTENEALSFIDNKMNK